MFEAKYSRLKFWIISTVLLIPYLFLKGIATILSGSDTAYDFRFTMMIIILLIIWLNTLANRIRDYGSSPWNALFALIPLVNLGMALYYGIAKGQQINTQKNNK